MTISDEEYKQRSRAYYSFIATKYCCECSDFFYRMTRMSADKSYRARKKLITQRLEQRVCLTQEYAERLRDENRKLKMMIRDLG